MINFIDFFGSAFILHIMKVLFILDYEFFGSKILNTAVCSADFCDMLWFRFKAALDGEILTAAENLRKALPNKTLILSEHPDIANKIGFDGVHLNSRSVAPAEVHLRFPKLITGFSAHSAEECITSDSHYITLSPIFKSKRGFPPLGVFPAPKDNVFLLGGVNSANIKLALGKGYAGVAGISFYKELAEIYRICKADE
jgi:thiamine-phosphate pyrophosphorylase